MNGQPQTKWIPLAEILNQPKPDQVRHRLKTEGVSRYERMAAGGGAFDVAADRLLDVIDPPSLAEQEAWDEKNVCERFEGD